MGHSLGAFATWRLAAEHPDMFAALGMISGGGDPGGAEKLREVPQYVVHGALDQVVPVERSRTMVKASKKAGICRIADGRPLRNGSRTNAANA